MLVGWVTLSANYNCFKASIIYDKKSVWLTAIGTTWGLLMYFKS